MKPLNSTESSPGGSDGWSRARLRAVALAGLAALGLYLCYRLAQPCFPALVWAGALALVFTPLQRWLEARLRRTNLAAACSLVIIGLLVVVPGTWFAQKLVEQATSVSETIQRQIAAGKWHVAGEEHPLMAHLVTRAEQQVNSPQSASTATSWLNALLSTLVKESALAAVQVCLTLYFLFYFLRDRVRVLQALRSFLPLSESDCDTLFARVKDTIHATLYGMVALSALQGVLGGLMFSCLGVPSPWFWALVAAAFAFVPVLDAFVLWLPAAVYLGLEGRWGEAFGVAALGSLVVRGLENFLYPVLVKDRLRVSSVGIFVALIGGLVLFGWSGLVLGPVILTSTSALLEICAQRFGAPQRELPSPEPPSPEPLKSTETEPTQAAGAASWPVKTL